MDDQVMKAQTWAILEFNGQDRRADGWCVELRHVPRAGLSRVPTLQEPLGADDEYQAEQWLTVFCANHPGQQSWTLKNPTFRPGLLELERYEDKHGNHLTIWPGIGRPGGESWYWRLNAYGSLGGVEYRDIICVRVGPDYFR